MGFFDTTDLLSGTALLVTTPDETERPLDSLRFLEATSNSELESGGASEIKIESTGVNFLDSLTASSQIDRQFLGVNVQVLSAGSVQRVCSTQATMWSH